MASKQKGLKIGLEEAGSQVRVRFFVGNTAWGCLTSATLPPTHTLTQMPKNLTFVVATQKRLGALPVVIIISAWHWMGQVIHAFWIIYPLDSFVFYDHLIGKIAAIPRNVEAFKAEHAVLFFLTIKIPTISCNMQSQQCSLGYEMWIPWSHLSFLSA